MSPLAPPAISTIAPMVDAAFAHAVAIALGGLFLVEVALAIRLWRSRKRTETPADGARLAKWIVAATLLVLLAIASIVPRALALDARLDEPPAPRDSIRVVARQWAFLFVYPGPDGRLDTPDDITSVDELHVEANAVHALSLQSKDVVHGFTVPALRLATEAIPGRETRAWIEATRTGDYPIECTAMCGMGHALMSARLVVESPAEHAAWIEEMAQRAASAARVK
jgi:cytochrome c oxidase subunit 2